MSTDDPSEPLDPATWGKRVAHEILCEYGDAAAIDTACYRVCSFIESAARLAIADSTVARLIGERMEPPRKMDI